MKTKYLIILCILCLLFCSSVAVAKQDALWPTKEFEVKWHSPLIEDKLTSLQPWIVTAMLSAEEKARLKELDSFVKNSLRDIAVYYDSAGIGAPNLPIEKGKDGVKRYIVYAYDFKDGWITTEPEEFAAGYYRGFCNKASTWDIFPKTIDLDPFEDKLALNLNSLGNQKISQLSPNVKRQFYSVMAHELFHAIQFSYDEKFSSILICKEQKGNGLAAVIEGTATAAAALATNDKYSGYINSLPWSNINLGAFPYGGLEEFLRAESDISVTSGDERALQYRTSSFWRYLAERFAEGEAKFGLGKVMNTLFRTGLANPTLKERYKWLDTSVKKVSGKSLYILFPEFTAEFGSHVTGRYQGDHKKWAGEVFHSERPCRPVKIDGADEKSGKIEILIEDALTRNTATCVNLEWSGVSEFSRIEVQAEHFERDIIDQLHLGVSYYKGAGQPDNCYKRILEQSASGNSNRSDLECSFGKVFPKTDEDGNVIKTWKLGMKTQKYDSGDFFARGLGDNGNATLILTNMAEAPGETKYIPLAEEKLTIRFSIEESEFADGRNFLPPEMIQLRDPAGILALDLKGFNRWWATQVTYEPASYQTPEQTVPVPDRYNMYGIQKKSEALAGGLGTTFQIVSVDDPSKKYSILPIGGEFKYGVTGKVNAIVGNEKSATSVLCNTGGQQEPPMDVTQSDENQLRFTIKTDLCKMMPNRKIEVVDNIDAKFVFAFGRRAYPDTAPQDIITPGLELYIDEYLKELVRQGVPLAPTVLMSDGSVPGDEDGDGQPDYIPTTEPGNNTDTKTNGTSICDCSCEQYRKMKEMTKTAPRTRAAAQKMRSMMACIQVCATKYGKCKN